MICYKISILRLDSPVTKAHMLHALLKCTVALHSVCLNMCHQVVMAR